MNASQFRQLISGDQQGGSASLARGLLRVAEFPYSLAVGWRNRRFDRGHAAIHQVEVPVISIGNLTLGGTGKTPMVKWVARRLAERGVRACVVSRGYGARSGDLNDEARELAQALPDLPHLQNPDRVAAAQQAIHSHGCQVVVLDDGFQHRRLARQLDIVLIDALEPFGFGHVFPRGTLREPLGNLRRADVVCLTRSDMIPPEERAAISRQINQLAPDAVWSELRHTPCELRDISGRASPLINLTGRRVAAFCGIGNPLAFRRTLENLECELVAWNEFPDHHHFSATDLAILRSAAADARAELVVCTHKDLVKVQRTELADAPLWALVVEMEVSHGLQQLEKALENALPAPPQPGPDAPLPPSKAGPERPREGPDPPQ